MGTPAFIEIGDDDLPVAPVEATVVEVEPPRRGHRPRTSDSAINRTRRQYRQDQRNRVEGVAITVASPTTAPDTIPEDSFADNDDLAAVVVKRTMKAMAAGKLNPTLRDGLTAQQLLDRRAEKAADRSFMLNLAMAMAGGGHKTPQKLLPPPADSPEDIIEGEFTEQNLAPAHLRSG